MSQKRLDFSTPALVGANIALTLLNDDGTPRNLAPYTSMTFQAAQGGPGGTIVTTKNTGAGLTIVDAGAGKINIALAANDIVDSGLYFHVINGQIGGGNAMRLAEGRISVSGSPVAA